MSDNKGAAVFILLLLMPLLILLGAGLVKVAWWLTDMGEWTGLGTLPWRPAFFIALMLGGAGGRR